MIPGIFRWQKREWISFFSILFILAVHLAILRYPIIYPDSGRYLSATVYLKADAYSPTVVALLMRPLFLLFGVWGYVIFQMTVLAYVLVSFLEWAGRGPVTGVFSVVVSAAGFTAATLMMDVYTVIGLLALFLLLNGKKDILLCLILSVSFIAHFGNVILFPFCAVFGWLFFNRKNYGLVFLLAILFLVPACLSYLNNRHYQKSYRFFGRAEYSHLCASLMADHPGMMTAYMDAHPESALAARRPEYLRLMSRSTGVSLEDFMWDDGSGEGFFDRLGGRQKFNEEARDVVRYAFRYYKGELVKGWMKRTVRFLIESPDYRLAFDRGRETLVSVMHYFVEDPLKTAFESLQVRHSVGRVIPPWFFRFFHDASFLTTALFVAMTVFRKKTRKTPLFYFSAFTLAALVANAAIIQNIGSYDRLRVRIMLLPTIAMFWIWGGVWGFVYPHLRSWSKKFRVE